MQMLLNDQITQLRKQKKLSQEELAAALQVSRQAVSKWENGVSNPDTENLIRLAEIFEVDVNVLIGCEGNQKSPQEEKVPDQRKLVRLLSVLLVAAVCAAMLFGTLWITERVENKQIQSLIEDEYGWDSVKLYYYVAFQPVEVPLSEENQEKLVSLVWGYPFTLKGEKAPITTYGGIMVDLEFVQNEVTYYWTFRPNAISCSITLADGSRLNCEYEPDHQVFEYLGYFY
jgi:transcriptional regulator with XRE-family HTH domain